MPKVLRAQYTLLPCRRPGATPGFCAWILLCLSFWQGGALADDVTASQRYQQALEQARAGRHAPALATLRALMAAHPRHRQYLYDTIVVLGWAERDEEALAFLPRLDPRRDPAYVLESLAKSARNLGRFEQAASLYRGVLQRFPARRPATLGLALTLADMGRSAEGQTVLAAWPESTDDLEILAARAYVAYRGGDYFSALRHYEAMARLDPGNREARRGRILVAARLGAPQRALELASADPGLLSAAEVAAFEADATALAIRWTRLPHDDPAARRAALRRIIARLESRLEDMARQQRETTPPARRSRFDLMVAYLDDRRPRDVVSLFEALPQDDHPLPAYVLGTAAEAYLQLRQPARALPLLEEALQGDPGNFHYQLSRIYALLESEDFTAAISRAEKLAEQQPPWLGKGPPAYLRPNPDRLSADTTAALVHAFADHLAEARQRLQELVARAPHNADLRTELGNVLRWRELPRAAEEAFRIACTADPRHLPARAGLAHALWDQGDYEAGAAILRRLRARDPEHAAVRDLARRWRIHNLRQLYITTGYSESSGVAEGGESFELDAWLYDRPRRYRHRFFLRSHLASARFTRAEGRIDYRRAGVGWEYRRRDLATSMELSRDAGDAVNPGLSLSALWRKGDHWRLGASYASYSNAVPLRGRLNEDLEGWEAGLDGAYVFHESRRIDIAARYLDFSDGNQRRSVQAGLFQRLLSQPRYKLDARAGFYASRNDRRNASYFNPRRDLSLDVTLTGEWLQYRRYERSFRHRIELGAGLYEQQDYGSGPTWVLRYEQQWNPGDRLSLRYGVSRARRLYDGDAEDITRIDLTLDWRF